MIPGSTTIRSEGFALDSLQLSNGYLGDVDCVVVLTNHPEFDYNNVVRTAKLVVDTRNALQGHKGEHIFRL